MSCPPKGVAVPDQLSECPIPSRVASHASSRALCHTCGARYAKNGLKVRLQRLTGLIMHVLSHAQPSTDFKPVPFNPQGPERSLPHASPTARQEPPGCNVSVA